MDFQEVVRARLLAAEPVVAAAADYRPKGGDMTKALFWMDRPQGSVAPALTLQIITEDRPQHMKGFIGLDYALVQLDAWGDTYAAARALAEAAITALVPAYTGDGKRFTRAFVDRIQDTIDRSTGATVFRTSSDLSFHHATLA